jgi:hypothetical protein
VGVLCTVDATFKEDPMPRPLAKAAATAVAAVLAFDGTLHLYWSTGSTWPAADRKSLSYAVLGSDVPFTPPVLLPLAALLFSAAAVVVLRARTGRRWRLLQYGTLAVGGGLTVRALAGLGWMAGMHTDAGDGSAFHRLNAFAYTPLCVLLAAACAYVALSGSPARALSGSPAHGR